MGKRRETVTENGSGSVDSGNEGVTQLEVYAPESMHRSSAATLELKSDEQIADVRVLVPLDKLYSVSGRVLTKEDREPLVAGQALLLDETDESFYRRGAIRPDGTWIIGFVPSGTYKVRFLGVRKMPDPGESEEEIRGRSYEASFPVVVSDGNLSMDDLLLNPAALTHPQ